MTGEKNTNRAGARKGACTQSQHKPSTTRPKASAVPTASREQLEIPEVLHRQLTHEALEGGVESFVMLLLSVEVAIKAGDIVTAQNLLFRSVTHAYENSGHHVTALMDFRDRMKLRLGVLRQPEEEAPHD